MLERGLISMDDDPHSPPPLPPQKSVSQNFLSPTITSHHSQDYHGYKNLQQSLPTTAVNELQQPKDLKPTLPTQSLLKTSLLAPSSLASLTSLSSSSLTAKPPLSSMQFQETKRHSQQQLNITELPIQQYNSILHTHLMSKQASTSSTTSLSGGLTTSISGGTFSSSGSGGSSMSENHQDNSLQNAHSQQFSLPVKQKQQNQLHLMQEIGQQQLRKSSSSTLTTTLLPHFVISTSSSNSSNTNKSNNTVSKNNSNCINDVSNNLTFNSLSSNNSSSNRNNCKNNSVNSWPKNTISSYQGQSANTVNSTATTTTVTTQTQTDDVTLADRDNLGMSENNAHLQMTPSSGVSIESSILSATTVNSVAGSTLTRRRPSNHHEAVTVVVFKTLLPDD